MQKTLLSIIISANFLLLVACQPRSDVETASETSPKESVDRTKLEQKPPVISKVTVTDSLVDAQTCVDLNKSMQKIDTTHKIEAIYNIQKQLKACLPTANNAEVLTLLKNYQAMYSRFLATDDYLDDGVFFDISEALDNGDQVSAEQLSAISTRNQYLLSLIEQGADVSLLYIGEGIFVFHHDLQAMANLFTPYLTKAQATFIRRMAVDNQDIFWNDAAVAVPLQEVIKRALFWEGYIQQYPDSYFIKDAKKLFALYRHVVFFGSDNTYWTDDLYREFYEPKDEQSIKDLSLRPNSLLAKDAKILLRFMAMPDNKRERKYPTNAEDTQNEENSEWIAWQKASDQLNQALPIASPWADNDANGYRDCLSSIICIDYEY